MSETIDAVLWCAALATWLMMFSAIIKDGVMKIVAGLRDRPGRRGS
ncbi:hypothetical protein [Bradyrhizobium guangzhouense]|nr:hypothetical protein [Bradyrhizobium guangzhouense]